MEMTYDGALAMPSSYAVMDEEEMTYVEGGFTITRTAFVWSISIAVGIAVTALTAGVGSLFASLGLKIVLASYSLRYALAAAIVKGIGVLGICIGNSTSAICGGIAGCGAGDLAGYVFDKWVDKLDGRKNGKLVF